MSNPILATGTPVLTVHDNRGLAMRVLNWNHDSSDNPLRLLSTQTQADDASRVVSHRDARLFAAWTADSTVPANLCITPSLAGQVLRRESTDSGEQVTLFDAAGRAVWSRDGRGTVQTVAYDEPGRPSSGSEQLSGSEIRVSWRSEYGDSGPADDGSQGNNLRGVCVAQYDSGGLAQVNAVALSGAVLSQGQRFLASAEALPDWPENEAGREALLEAETYTTSVTADARGAVLTQTNAKDHLQAWRYNVSGAVCHQTVTPAGGKAQTLLDSVTWSAAGQVLTESAGNGVTTTYGYDPQNQWLATITAQRADNTTLQALSYGYDNTGNVTSLSDGSVASHYYRNQATSGARLFTYDALYQLLSATGRENADHTGTQYSGLPVMSDGSQYVNYTRSYTYDDSGNLSTLKHTGAASFTRTMTTESTSDRSVQQNDGGAQTPEEVANWFDDNGNLLMLQARAPVTDDNGLDPLVWDGSNNLQSVMVLSRSSGDNDREIYQYSGSQRVRKQTRTLVNGSSGLWSVDEVRYLPGLELRKSWQETAGSSATPSLTEELHVITGQAGRAGIRVLHWETGKPQEIAANDQVRWSVDDNIGSLALELDSEGQLISREEYYPFGGTAVWTARNEVEASYKIVRYSGKERDGSGLYYYGHRYYAPWLCRWVSADPAGEVDGLNLFRMVRNNPVTFFDAKGNETTSHASFHDATKLSSISMLGSHDAGTYAFSRRRNGILSSLGSLLPWAFKTQNKTLLEQAKAGARYFDIRIALRKDGSYGFFHGPSVAAGDAVADIRALLEYAKNDKGNFYLLKIRFQSDKRSDDGNNTLADNFLINELAPYRENLIRPEDIAPDPADNRGLGDATVSLLSEGKNIAVMTDHYTGEHSSWNYKEQVHTKWANRADVKKTGEFLEGFHNQAGPQNKITIIQTNMPVASIGKGLVTRGVGNYLSRVKDRLATFVDRIKSPGVISADYIGSKKGATAAFNRKIERSNEPLIQMHTKL